MTEIKKDYILFMFGGNATFTITDNDKHYSYKIYKKKTTDNSKIYYLFLKKANKATYCGYFKIVGNKLSFKHSDKNDIKRDNMDMNVLLDVIHNRHNLPENIKVYHSGRCGCCGRLLTDPDSMARGFGKECWKKVKEFTKERS